MLQAVIQSLKIVTVVLLAVGIIFAGQHFFAYYVNHELPNDTGQPISFTVSKDDDSTSVAKHLVDKHLIRSELVFKTQFRLANSDLKPGTYTIRKGTSVADIIDIISGTAKSLPAPEVKTVKLTAIEGWRTEQIAEAAGQAGLQGGAQAFIKATKQVSASQYDFLSDRPKNASLEGYLFPDTYNFKTDSPDDLVAMMLQNFGQKFDSQMRERAKAMNMSIYQVLTIASIVEREAQVESERPIIASVYLNRLRAGMALQADPTVQYAVGKAGDWWPEHLTNAQLQVNNPYNTYVHDGWPPGPICNPGLASITAVLNPDNDNYLYFVAKGDGTHAFAETYAEQQANEQKYLGVGGSSTAPAQATAPAADTGDLPAAQGIDEPTGETATRQHELALAGASASGAQTGPSSGYHIVQHRGST